MSTEPVHHRILVPIDGSECSDAAVGFALRFAGPTGELIFANAFDINTVIAESTTPYGGDPSIVIDALETDRRELFAAATARARAAGVSARTFDLDGSAVDVIVELSGHVGADAIVMGTHGRRGLARAALGSVADGVLRRADIPTFVVRAESNFTAAPDVLVRRIAAAIDASDAAAAAAAFAVDLAAAYRAEVTFVHVDDGPRDEALEHAVERLRLLAAAAGVRSDVVHAYGRPRDAIVTAAAKVHADLIAIGTHGRDAVARLLLGSVAEGVVLTSAVPVVVVRANVPVAAPHPAP